MKNMWNDSQNENTPLSDDPSGVSVDREKPKRCKTCDWLETPKLKKYCKMTIGYFDKTKTPISNEVTLGYNPIHRTDLYPLYPLFEFEIIKHDLPFKVTQIIPIDTVAFKDVSNPYCLYIEGDFLLDKQKLINKENTKKLLQMLLALCED